MQDSRILLLISTFPDQATAESLAHCLLEQHLVACVNIMPGIQSLYTWQGHIEKNEECILLIKTHQDRYAAVEQFIQAQHPYDLPELIALPVTNGLPAYLDWVAVTATVPAS